MRDSTVDFDCTRICRETEVRSVDLRRELASTNDRALELAATAPPAEIPLLVVATRQSGGRGRGDHRWWAGEGALTFSLVIDTNDLQLVPRRWPRVSLATAIAVANTIHGQFSQARSASNSSSEQHENGQAVRVKWPNDIFVNGRKICGILTENVSAQPQRLVIGIGLNVNNSWSQAPAELRDVGTSMRDEAQQRFSLQLILIDLLQRLHESLAAVARDTFPLTEGWRELCMLEGHTVTIEVGNQQTTGVCQGIDEEGALLLQSESGIQRCVAGTVTMIR